MKRRHELPTFRFRQEKNGKEKVEIDATGFPAIILALKTKLQVLGTCYRQTAQKQAGFDALGKIFSLIESFVKLMSLFGPSQDNYLWMKYGFNFLQLIWNKGCENTPTSVRSVSL